MKIKSALRIFLLLLLISSLSTNSSVAQDRKITMLDRYFHPIAEEDSSKLVYYSVFKELNESQSMEKIYTKEMRHVRTVENGINQEGGFAQKIIDNFDENGKLSSRKIINSENKKYFASYFREGELLGEVVYDGFLSYEIKKSDSDEPIVTQENPFEPKPSIDNDQWNQFLMKNLAYPTQARRMKQSGTVLLKVLIDKNSNLVLVEVANSQEIAKSLGDEALRVIKLYKGKFTAAVDLDGNPVEAWLTLPIRFKFS